MTWKRSEIREARHQNLKPIVERLGYELRDLQNENYLVLGLPSEVIIKRHYWICTDDGSGGNAIDFLTQILDMSFHAAMDILMPKTPALR